MLLDRQRVDDAEVLVLHGLVDDAPSLRTAVAQALGACSRGVVIDLTGAQALTEAAVDAVTAAVISSGPRPALAVCCTPSSVRTLLEQRVAVHDDRQHALDTLEGPASHRDVDVEHSPHGPRQARQAVQAWADDIGLGPVVDDLLLIVSELVTNAVRYGTPPVRVAVSADDRSVTVGVVDGTAERPAARAAGGDAEGGRGMLLLSVLSAAHGVRDQPPGKVVWASLER